jgi:hypothetical protein
MLQPGEACAPERSERFEQQIWLPGRMPARGAYQWLAVIQVNGAHYEAVYPF